MNNRQKTGVGMLVSGAVTLLIGVVVMSTVQTPEIVNLLASIIPTVLTGFGLVVNLPSNTDPR